MTPKTGTKGAAPKTTAGGAGKPAAKTGTKGAAPKTAAGGAGKPAAKTGAKRAAPKTAAGEAGKPVDSSSTAEIQRRAYEIYLGRNCEPGDPVSDWLEAERELRDAKSTGRS